nr:hypothetical protein [Tanacetum cinerariifolium]
SNPESVYKYEESRKRVFEVEKPLFEGMLVEQQVDEEGDADENVEEVNAGDAAEGDVSAAHGEVPTVAAEPSIPSPTPPTPPPQPPQDIPLTSQSRDKVAQALEITKLKRRVKKLERMNKDDVVVLEDDKEEDREVVDAVKDVEEAKDDKEEDREVADAVKDVEEAKEDETKPAKVQEVVDVVTTAKLITKEPKPLKKKQQIEQDEQYARELHVELNKDIDWDEAIDHVKRKAKEDHAVKRYQVLKRKPQTEAQARKNMMMYLKNVVGFKMDYFKGMSSDDIRLIFEAKFNSNRAAKRRKLDEKVEELKRHLQIVPNEDDDVYTEATPLARKVPVVDYQIIKMNNKPYYKIIRADDAHQLYIITLGAMSEKPDIHAQIWKNQRIVHGPAKVKGWKLLKSYGVQIITFTSTQLILLIKKKYPLTRFTLDQMLNAVRLEVKEESEVSLEVLRFTRQQHQECQLE